MSLAARWPSLRWFHLVAYGITNNWLGEGSAAGIANMLYMIRFTDHLEKLSLRLLHQREHTAWLNGHKDRILVVGGLREEPDGAPVGALWIVEAPTRLSVETLYKSDPYFLAGLRRSVDVLIWTRCWTTERVAWADLLGQTA
jgi:uncharacterized protein YciI